MMERKNVNNGIFKKSLSACQSSAKLLDKLLLLGLKGCVNGWALLNTMKMSGNAVSPFEELLSCF